MNSSTKATPIFRPGRHRGAWSWAPKGGRYGIHAATSDLVLNGRPVTAADAGRADWDRDGDGRHILTLTYRRPRLEYTITFTPALDGQELTLHATLTNRGASAVCLGACRLVTVAAPDGRIRLGPRPREQLVFVYSGGHPFTGVVRISHNRGRHDSAILGQVYNPASSRCLTTAFTRFDRRDTRIQTRYTRQHIVHHEATCDFAGYWLQPGATIDTETLSLRLADDPHAELIHWAESVAQHYRPQLNPQTPAGWLGWSWVDPFQTEPYEQVVKRNAHAIRRRLPGLGLDYIWISIGNLADGLPGNWTDFNPSLFPNGFANTVRELRNMGLKPGLWFAPFMIAAGTTAADRNRGNFLVQKNGQPSIGARRWGWNYTQPREEQPCTYNLDGSHPRTLTYLREVLEAYREMGIRYYMVDFLCHGVPGPADHHYDKRLIRGPAVERAAMQAVREAAGPGTHLVGSSGPTTINVGCLDAARIGNDYGEGRHLAPQTPFYPATFQVNDPHSLHSHAAALRAMAGHYFTHRRLYINDSNVLTVDRPVPRNEAEIAATLFAVSGSPFMVGDDIDRMSEDRLALLRKLLPRTADMAVPVDLFERPAPDDYPHLFVLPVKRQWDPYVIAAVFNLDDRTFETTVIASHLGFDGATPWRVFEFWEERYLGTFTSGFTAVVPPLSCRLYRIAPRRPYPWLLSSNLHVLQGSVELSRLAWDAQSGVLQGTMRRIPGETGDVYIVAPENWKPKQYRGLFVAKDNREHCLLIRKPVQFAGHRIRWRITFEQAP